MYKEKYLKYKNKYLALKEHKYLTYSMNSNKAKHLELKKSNNFQIGGAPEFTTIKADSLLFRCAPNIANLRTYERRLANVKLCEDTLKTGLYFGNQAVISLAMCIEYNKLMELGVFKVVQDIEQVSDGKYAFRGIHPERYTTPDGKYKPHVALLPEENISHIGCGLQLLGAGDDFLLPPHIQMGLDCLGSCEIFLSTLNPEHLRNIEMIAAYRFNPALIKTADDLHRYMIENHYPFELKKYVDDGVLIQLRTQ